MSAETLGVRRSINARRLLLPFVGLIIPVIGVTAWWILSAQKPSFYFPSLATIWDRFVHTWLLGGATAEIWPTLSSLFLGYAAATLVGITLGVVFALLPSVNRFFAPLLEFVRAVPGLALIPLFVIALGVGIETKIGLVIFGAVWPILLNTVDGIRSQDLTIRDTVFSYRLRFRDRLFRVVLPSASPQIMAGMKVSLSISVIVVIATEMVVSINGIGNFLLKAQAGFDLTGMWSGLILMGIIGYLLNVIFELVERRVLRWHRAMYEGNRR
ncbi:ABC transporter permease [Subtercola lobariae]|uniref:Nitrate ABC transporter permease n=1 Tax=Subtercola lobariae TaxID=1588641 RepID=A0A917B085_9MICO|nr:ABC transporter permease [Subtercola lobariae]GGF11847.1 nitrate ABC transporter permease [Subtercola lobariae]